MKDLKLRNNENLSDLELTFLRFQSSYVIPFTLKIPKHFMRAVENNIHHTDILFNKILIEALENAHNVDQLTQTLKEVAGLDIIIDDELLDLDNYMISKLLHFYMIDAICNSYSVIKIPKSMIRVYKKYENEIKKIYTNDDSAIQSLETYSSNILNNKDIIIVLSRISVDNLFINIPLSITTDYLCHIAFLYSLLIDLLDKESLINK